jgi:hypothetical protein
MDEIKMPNDTKTCKESGKLRSLARNLLECKLLQLLWEIIVHYISIYKQQFFCRTYSIAVNTTVSNVMSTVALLTKAILTLQYFLNLSVSIQNKYRNFKPVEITLRRGLM